MLLTVAKIRALKPREQEYTVSDGQSLYLVVSPAGGKLWRMTFRFAGKQRKLAMGSFPVVSLSEARASRDRAKALIAQGVNPAEAKQEGKRKAAPPAKPPTGPTLQSVIDDYVAYRARDGAKASTVAKMGWFSEALGGVLLGTPIEQVTKASLLEQLKVHERMGHLEKVSRMRTFVGRVVDYAEASGILREGHPNPAAKLSRVLASPRVRHHAALFRTEDVGGLLRSIDGYSGDPSTWFGLRLAPELVLRSSELRRTLWSDVSWADELIRIPGSRMKKVNGEERDHIVPLTRQSRALLEEAMPHSGPRPGARADTFILPSLRSAGRPVSENTFTAAFRRMGYTGDEVTHHGLRRTFSTWLNEAGIWKEDWIETQLAHGERNKVRGAYNAALYLEHRRPMMQGWSDMLEAARRMAPGRP